MAISKAELQARIKSALDFDSDKDLDEVGSLSDARDRIAQKIADAVEEYVVTRTVQVTGVQTGSGSVIGRIE